MLVSVLIAAQYIGTLEVGNRTEVRARATQTETPGVPPQGVVYGVDLMEQPAVHARLTDRRWEYDLAYTPMLTLPDVENGIQLTLSPPLDATNASQLLQIGRAGVAWHDRIVRLSVTEDVTYGSFNSANLVPLAQASQAATSTGAGAPPVQLSPAPQTIQTLSSRTQTTVNVRPSRRVSYSLGATWLTSGGLDTASQAVLPQQEGPRGDASLSYALSRRDEAMTLAYAQGYSFTSAPCAFPSSPGQLCELRDQVVQVRQGIRHDVERSTTVMAAAGVAVGRSRLQSDQPYDVAVFPTADMTLTHRFADRGAAALQIRAQLEPAVDFRTGALSNRAQGQASLSSAVSEVITLHAFANCLQTVPASDPLAATMVGGGAGIDLHAARSLTVTLSQSGMWQKQDPFGSFFSTFSSLAVTVAAPALRF